MKYKKSKLVLLMAMIMSSVIVSGCGSSGGVSGSDSASGVEDKVSISSIEKFESIPGTSAAFQVSNISNFALTAAAAMTAKNIRLYFDDEAMADKFTVSYDGCDELPVGGQCSITVTQLAGDDSMAEGIIINAYIQGDNSKKLPIVITVERLDIVDDGGFAIISPSESPVFSIVNPTDYSIKEISFNSTAPGVSLSDDCNNQIVAGSSCRLTISVSSSAVSNPLGLGISGANYKNTADGRLLEIVRPQLSSSINYINLDNPDIRYNVVTPGQRVSIILYNNTAGNAYGLNLKTADLNAIVSGLSVISNSCSDTLLAHSQCTVKFEAKAGSSDDNGTWTVPEGDNFYATSTDIYIQGQLDNLNLSADIDYVITSSNTPTELILNVANTTGYDVTQLALSRYDSSKFVIDNDQSSCDDLSGNTLPIDGKCQYVFSYNPGEVSNYYTKDYNFAVEGSANGVDISASAAISSINFKLFYTIPFDALLNGNQLLTRDNRFATVANVNGVEKLISGTRAGLAISSDDGSTWHYITTGQGLASNNISVSAYYVDEANNLLYVGTTSGGMSIIDLEDNTVVRNYTTTDGLMDNEVKAFEQVDTAIFVGTDSALSVLDISNGVTNGVITKTYDDFNGKGVLSLLADGDNLFVGTSGGIFVLDISSGSDQGVVTKNYTRADDGLGNDNVYALLKYGSNIFAATLFGAAVLDISNGADQGSVTRNYNVESLPSPLIFTFAQNDSNLFIGTRDGVSVLDVSKGADQGVVTKTYTNADGLADKNIRSLAFGNNTLYISTSLGSLSLLEVSPTNGEITVGAAKPYYFPSEEMGDSVLYEGIVYTATYGGGLYRFNAKNNSYIDSITTSNGLPSNAVRSLVLDGGTLYAGSGGGGLFILDLTQTDPNKMLIKTYTNANDGLPSDNITSILKDGSTIFIGTDSGLSILDISNGIDNGNLIKNNTTADGVLRSDFVFSNLLKDGNAIFIGTSSGLAILDISDGIDSGVFIKNYTGADGLGSNIINALVKDGNTIFVGTQGCLIKIQRNKYTDWMLNALKQLFYGSYSCSQEVIGLC